MNLYPALSALSCVRRVLLVGAVTIASITLLQGCFPIMVAGVGATALVAADRRTSGTYIEDESIEWKVSNLIRKHFGTLNRVNTTSYNRIVLLTGEVQNESVSAEAERLAGTITNVRGVVNELVVAPSTTFWSRRNDDAISANVKARFLNNGVFLTNHVKVVADGGVVFLLGLVTHAEAEKATEIARESKGARKVVRVFEYIGEDEAKAIDSRGSEGEGSEGASNEGSSNSESSDFPPEAP